MGNEVEKVVTGKEKFSYGLYFMGQNIFYMIIYMYLTTYYTDIGISAAAVAIIALIVKIWDAVNDPIFGALMDKFHFKKGTFVPWLKISLVGIPLATIFMFATPNSISPAGKIAWAVIGYMLWDTAYTLCDVPIFGLVTTLTPVQQERTSLNAIGRVCAMIAAMLVMIVIPSFRTMLGGWTKTVVMLSVIAVITMLPICFTAQERVGGKGDSDPSYGLKDMFKYLGSNKYLLIYYVAFLVYGTFNIASTWSLYIARICLQNESISSVTSLICFVPIIILGIFVPLMTKKWDKFKLYYFATILTGVLTIVKYFVGYSNLVAYLAMTLIATLPVSITTVVMYMFTPDCVEYGHYKTGNRMPGITFATQTFFVKLQSAFVTAFAAAMLSVLGFVEGEGATQAAGFADKMWAASNLLPVVGIVLQLVILHFYKLNDHDVQLMAKVNTGEMDRTEAEAQMINKY